MQSFRFKEIKDPYQMQKCKGKCKGLRGLDFENDQSGLNDCVIPCFVSAHSSK